MNAGVNLKITAAVCVAVAVAVVVGVAGIVSLGTASASAQSLYANNVPSVLAIGRVDAALAQGQLDLANAAISVDAATGEAYRNAFEQDQKEFATALADYRANGPAGDPALVAALETKWNALVQAANDKLLALGRNDDLRDYQSVRDTQVTGIMQSAGDVVDKLRAAESADAAGDAAAARTGARDSRIRAIVLVVVGALIALALGIVVARSIVGSLARVKTVCDGLAEGDLTRTSGLTSGDEPGQMGRALDVAMERLRTTVATIDGSAGRLNDATQQMAGTVAQIAASAESTAAQAQTASAAAEHISRSVDSVSAGSQQMGASIREISQNASEAAQVAGEAVGLAAQTSTTMSKLGASSAEIGNVIMTITSIAEQTNLLALNATIEAARAGEAGKGFAVVASEVKDLAQETARATEDISRRVAAIQADTEGALVAIEEITRVIARISDFQTTIASAVEEQTATTSEMSRSVDEAATGTNDIAQNITGVAESARVTSRSAVETEQATVGLARLSTELSELVSGFRY
ncbi:methyl-accepting chemotaxis protein [Actinoplanes sp. CA-030573]|uniref:methyl-accepting chemotaxis protein n=1 Tax=Actinoplanes sp. CA-030573 TaxID=3239898 RepID=UPI003D8CF94A